MAAAAYRCSFGKIVGGCEAGLWRGCRGAPAPGIFEFREIVAFCGDVAMQMRMLTCHGAAFMALMSHFFDSAPVMGSFPHFPSPLFVLFTSFVATAAAANQTSSATTAPPPSTTSPTLNYQPSPLSNAPSTSTSFIDLIIMDPFFPYYAAGAALYLLNIITVGFVGCCCKGLPIGDVVKAVALSFLFGVLAWAFVFLALKKHTGRYCCCGASQIKIKMKKGNDHPQQEAADSAASVMAKHKTDFLERNGPGQLEPSGGGNADVGDGYGRYQVANGRPFFVPFGLQFIPDPYGPPLPTPYSRPATIARA